ncbi:MAG: hypothetical protein ACPL4E_10285 [Thermoproteota archaeon]
MPVIHGMVVERSGERPFQDNSGKDTPVIKLSNICQDPFKETILRLKKEAL